MLIITDTVTFPTKHTHIWKNVGGEHDYFVQKLIVIFFYNQMQFFWAWAIPKRIQTITFPEKGDVNKGISVHITTLLLRWIKVLDGMLFRGSLPLELNRDLQQWMRLWLNITRSWYVLLCIMDVWCTAYTNWANTFLVSFPSKNSDLSSMLETWPSELNIVCSRLILVQFHLICL